MGTTVYVIEADAVEFDWIAAALALTVQTVVRLESGDAVPAEPPPGGTCCLVTSEGPGAENALRLVAGLRRRGVKLPVIVLGPHTAFRAAVDLARMEATDFLEHPVGARELRSAVRRVCK